MRANLRKAWESRSPRDRRLIVAMAVVLLVAGSAWLMVEANQARTGLRTSVAGLRRDAATLVQQGAEVRQLRAAPAPVVSDTPLAELVRARAGAAGLSAALVSVEASDESHVTVVFGAVSFADWLAWVDQMRPLQVRLETCRIEAMSSAGMISVTATLARPAPP